MKIQINGVYEYDTGYKDYELQRPKIIRIYVYKKIRKYYRCFINQEGTDCITHDHISGEWLREHCRYLGQSCSTWRELFYGV